MRVVPIFLCVAMVVSTVHADDELVDSAQYTSWASHKPGTSVTQEMTTETAGFNVKMELIHVLKSVEEKKATVEVTTITEMMGKKNESKKTVSIPRKVKKGREDAPADAKGTFTDKGTETIEVAGKSYECKVFEFSGESAQGKASGTVWNSVEVPGNTVKMDSKAEGAGMTATTKLIVTKIELK